MHIQFPCAEFSITTVRQNADTPPPVSDFLCFRPIYSIYTFYGLVYIDGEITV